MKKFLNIFFVVLGVIFFILIIIGTYLFVADPFHIKPLLSSFNSVNSVNLVRPIGSINSTSTTTTNKNSNLTPTQQKALQTIGVDPATVPTSFTPEQQSCFIKILGQARVDAIKAGSFPTATEYLSVRGCL